MSIRAKGSAGKLSGVAVVIRKNGDREEIPISMSVSEEQSKVIEQSIANNNSDPIIKEK